MVYEIHVLVKELAQWLYAGDPSQCTVKTVVQEREWLYCFELKGVLRLGLHVEKRDGALQLTVREFQGNVRADVFAFGKLALRNVAGAGASVIVEVPAPKPKPPAPPMPPVPPVPAIPEVIPPPMPGQEPLTARLDMLISIVAFFEGKLDRIREVLELFPVKANTYSVVTVDLGVARPMLEEFNVGGFALTVFSNNGTFDLKIGELATDTLTIKPLTYPAMLTFDRIEFEKFFVGNVAQAGKQATLIVWRRE